MGKYVRGRLLTQTLMVMMN